MPRRKTVEVDIPNFTPFPTRRISQEELISREHEVIFKESEIETKEKCTKFMFYISLALLVFLIVCSAIVLFKVVFIWQKKKKLKDIY